MLTNNKFNQKKLPTVGIEPLDHHVNALLTELRQYLVASLNTHDLYKVELNLF